MKLYLFYLFHSIVLKCATSFWLLCFLWDIHSRLNCVSLFFGWFKNCFFVCTFQSFLMCPCVNFLEVVFLEIHAASSILKFGEFTSIIFFQNFFPVPASFSTHSWFFVLQMLNILFVCWCLVFGPGSWELIIALSYISTHSVVIFRVFCFVLFLDICLFVCLF